MLDGAMATELEVRGANLHDPLWSAKLLVENPALIEEVHYDYFRAGADIAITASYQATFEGFAQRGIEGKQAADLMHLSIRLAASARDRYWEQLQASENRLRPLVAVSIGPYGAWLHDGSEYRGDYDLSIQELIDFHRPRMELFAESIRAGEADLFAFETIPCLAEAEAIVHLLVEIHDVPAWISFSCCDGKHICYGESFAESIEMVSNCDQVVAAGLNCTSPRFVMDLLQSVDAKITTPLVVYPNSGESWDAQSGHWSPESKVNGMGEMSTQWHTVGAKLIGGCCRTTPEDIREMCSALRNMNHIARIR
ncbi:homocysteine S-methyltransferase [Chloroflexi bacterium TSY]|nr:homocysteine S-methyltransferase [Chloroflexi bacterium TSY]